MSRIRFNPFPPVPCAYGAPMGRRGDPADSWDGVGRLHACSAGGDGDYDRGGAYWGRSDREGWVYAVWTRKGEWCTYVRARSRADAIAKVRAEASTRWTVEYTDTFGGEANYAWAERATIELPHSATRATIMRAAKRATGLAGVRGRTSDYGEGYEFRPFGSCTVLFVEPKY